MNPCHLCAADKVTRFLDCRMQPVCNRFLASPTEDEFKHPMIMGQCEACGLVQIINPVPARELLPQYDWITYNEPEGHLDELAEIVGNLPGLTRESAICGISFKDDSTLRRLKQRGFERTWRIDPAADLGIGDRAAGVETIQDRLTSEAANKIARKYGAPDVVIVRHILEHAHDPLGFMRVLGQLVNPEGYVVFEAPDCTLSLEKYDYTTLWEEHIVYFTPETFRHCFGFGGFSLVRFECYPYPYENSLIGIVQPRKGIDPGRLSISVLEAEKSRALAFSQGLTKQRAVLTSFFSEYRKSQGDIAVFGAGHLACAFINLMELKDYIEFVVDDHPNKAGLFMPGSRLPILGSAALLDGKIKLCLLSLSPESEGKVIQRNQIFIQRGGTFASIFPASKNALQM